MKSYIDVLADRIIDVFKRSPGRLLYVGDVANDIGWSLERTEQFLHTLVQDRVRPATDDEKLALNPPAGIYAALYVLY